MAKKTADSLRKSLLQLLGIPEERCELAPEPSYNFFYQWTQRSLFQLNPNVT